MQGCCNVPPLPKSSEMCINGISNSILKWALVKLAQILLWACPSFPLLQKCPLHLERLCTNKRKILYTFHIILYLYFHSFKMFNVHFDFLWTIPSRYLSGLMVGIPKLISFWHFLAWSCGTVLLLIFRMGSKLNGDPPLDKKQCEPL